MLDLRKQLAFRHAVAPQLVGYDHPRHVVQTLQQAPEETLGCFPVAAFLNQDVDHHAILIHGAPKIVLHALDPDEHLVQVPLISRPWPSVTQAVGKALAEFLEPPPHCLIGDDNTTLGQEQLDIWLRLNTWYNQTA